MDETFKFYYEKILDYLHWLSEPVISINSSKISIISILVTIFIFIFSLKISSLLGKYTSRYLAKREVDSGVRDSIGKFVKYLSILIAIIFSLENLGISLSSLATFGAVLMVGIGFGLQNIASNFISGIILLIERPIKVGDIVKTTKFSGRVIDIRVRATIIETRDGVSIIMPNSKLVSEEVINESYAGKNIRQHIKVGIAYDSDVGKAIKILCESALKQDHVISNPPPAVLLENFGESALYLDLRFWCTDIWTMEKIASEIRLEINERFKENNIIIPFPQRDVHFDKIPSHNTKD